jgi:hypothetical protein
MKKIKKAYLGKAIRQPTETDTEFEIRHENHTPFSDKYYKGQQKSKMKPAKRGMGLQDENLKPGKTKIIKAQLGRIIKDNLSPEEKAQLDAYKKTVVNKKSFDKESQDQDSYRKRMQEYQAEREVSRMPRQSSAMEEASRMPRQVSQDRLTESDINTASETLDQLYRQSLDSMMGAEGAVGRKKGGMTKAQKKVGSVMREFKAGKLHSGKKGPVVKSPKQAIAIALSEAGMSKKKMQSGGMVRGSGIAIRGIKKSRIY